MLVDEWGLDESDLVLDPFVGAGTTILAAKEKGIPATGDDLLTVGSTRVWDKDCELQFSKAWEGMKETSTCY